MPQLSRFAWLVLALTVVFGLAIAPARMLTAQAGPVTSATGRVTIAVNGQPAPIRRARVTLIGAQTGPTPTTDTDTDGRYRLDGIAPGTYRLVVAKPGFVPVAGSSAGSAGTPITVTAGANVVTNVTMTQAAAIEGRLVNEAGDAGANLTVAAIQIVTDANGSRQVPAGQVRTDDLGRFRLHTLAAGEYVIDASPDPVALRAATPPGQQPQNVHTYFPGTPRVEDAQRVIVGLSQEARGMDFTVPGGLMTPQAMAALLATPRNPSFPTGTGAIAGRVTRGDASRPAPFSSIRIVRWEGGLGSQMQVRADEQGRFEATALPAGSYQLTASADGFLDRDFGQVAMAAGKRINLSAGQRFDQANIMVLKPSAVEGRVLDEFGDPVPGTTVQIASVQFVAGARRLAPVGNRIMARPTDDQGRFRIFNLPPDDYYVMALSGAFAGDSGPAGFAPTFFPGTRVPTDARVVRADIGRDVSDVVFALEPAVMSTVSGVVIDPSGQPVQSGVMLMQTNSGDVRMMVLAQAQSAADGSFSFRNVSTGTYAVQAFGRAGPGVAPNRVPFGSLSVDVAGAQTSGLRVVLSPGGTMRGRIIFEGEGQRPASGGVSITPGPANFISAPVIGSGFPPTTLSEDGTFEVPSMSGLRIIRVGVRPEIWTLKQVMLNGKDVTDAPVDFRNGDVNGVEITLTSRASSVSGAVTAANGQPATDYAVVIFANDSAKWVYPTRMLALARPNQTGRFEATGLPPGDYVAAALERVPQTAWQDPVFLQTLRGVATPFSVREGEQRMVQLKIVR